MEASAKRRVINKRPPLSEEFGSTSDNGSNQHSPVKTPIILAKNDKALTIDTSLPPKLLKAAESGEIRLATSPKPMSLLGADSGQPKYTIQQRDGTKAGSHQWSSVQRMTESVKIIDEMLHWSGESLADNFLDQSEFRVIGIIGNQGVGKSHVMSLLANYGQPGANAVFGGSRSSTEHIIGPSTCGLDLYITSGRTILIDCQPVYSTSVLDGIIKNERRYNSDFGSPENIGDAATLQLVMFMLSVCHIVLVVEDCFTDPNLHRLIHTAEMLRPTLTQSSEKDESMDYHAVLVFVQNKMQITDIHKNAEARMRTILENIYRDSSLNFEGNSLERKDMTSVNLCCLPIRTFGGDNATLPEKQILENFERKFVKEVMSLPYVNLVTQSNLTEKDWLKYSFKMWDAARKSPLLSEFIRLGTLNH